MNVIGENLLHTPPFASLGKEVLWRTTHYADACTDSAARQIAHALNHLSHADTLSVRPPSGGGHSASPAHFGDTQ